MNRLWNKKLASWLLILLALCLTLCSCSALDSLTGRVPSNVEDDGGKEDGGTTAEPLSAGGYASIAGIPDYSGAAYVELEGNQPRFANEEITVKSFERYADLDALGRCGETLACIGKDLMPTAERESISSVKPTGWVNNKYDTDLVDGGYIYNRCHLIGFQLTGENANRQNLITGTRYLNIEGMLPFENMVADYVKETGNHVMYRVTPLFAGNNLLPSGVRMEAYSVEDDGEGICFHVFAYNVQPGITINYATGENWLNEDAPEMGETTDTQTDATESTDSTDSADSVGYVLNTSRKKIHLPTCSAVADMNESNRQQTDKSKAELIKEGYSICGICKP